MKSNRYELRHAGEAHDSNNERALLLRSMPVLDVVRTPQGWDGAMCPVCRAALRRTAQRGPSGVRLIHRSTADDDRCPLTTLSWQPDGLPVHKRPDPRTTRIHYAAFLTHWVRHYAAAKRLVPSLSIQRFAYLVEYANALHLWSHPMLRMAEVPYVLLALAEFIRQPNADGDSTWVHFFFDRSVRDVSDLWLAERPADRQFFRMTYGEPVFTPFPTSAELICWEVVDRDEPLTAADLSQVGRQDVRVFNQFIARLAVGG